MSNIISFDNSISKTQPLVMSNGLSDVFIDVLVLAGSYLAKQSYEKELIVWLAEKDQSVVGIGTIGFDVVEMPWQLQYFEKQKSFLLKTIHFAINRTGWENLEYEPTNIVPDLKQFEMMIISISTDDIIQENRSEWLNEADENDPVKCGFPYCQKHNVLLSCFGCKICR